MGLILDIYIVYAIKAISRFFKQRSAGEWQLVEAVVLSAVDSRGYPDCRIVYSYSINGQSYSGSSDVPFMFRDSAKEYAAGFEKGRKLYIRVKPGEHEISTMRDEDQAIHPVLILR